MSISVLVWAAIASAVQSSGPDPEKLVYLCENIPPSNFVEDGKLTGISVEMLRAVWERMGVPEQSIKVVPWARGYNALLTEKSRVLFSMSRTPERESRFKWAGPIFTVKNVFLGLASSKLRIARLSDAKSLRIGTIKDDVVEKMLAEAGFDPAKVDGVSALEQDFEKLRHGRIDLIAHSQQTLREFIKEKNYRAADFSVYFVFSQSPNYYAFSLDVPDSLVQRFQKAIDGLGKEHDQLLDKYGLNR